MVEKLSMEKMTTVLTMHKSRNTKKLSVPCRFLDVRQKQTAAMAARPRIQPSPNRPRMLRREENTSGIGEMDRHPKISCFGADTVFAYRTPARLDKVNAPVSSTVLRETGCLCRMRVICSHPAATTIGMTEITVCLRLWMPVPKEKRQASSTIA